MVGTAPWPHVEQNANIDTGFRVKCATNTRVEMLHSPGPVCFISDVFLDLGREFTMQCSGSLINVRLITITQTRSLTHVYALSALGRSLAILRSYTISLAPPDSLA